jgi:hypothetical protein
MSETSVKISDVVCTRETEKALLVIIDEETYWIPKSQIHDDSEVYALGCSGVLVISEWIAEQKGLL